MLTARPVASFVASATTFGQRLDQVLADARSRLGRRVLEPVLYTHCPDRPVADLGVPRSPGCPGDLASPADLTLLRPLPPDSAAVVVVAVRAGARVAVYWDWRYAYTYSRVSPTPSADSPFSLEEELALHSLPSAATVMDYFPDQVLELAPAAV